MILNKEYGFADETIIVYLLRIKTSNTMEKITITIPDNLDTQAELLAIAKQLGQQLLPTDKTKRIGDEYSIKHLQTQITVKREAVEKPIVTRDCTVCGTVFEQSLSFKLKTNYGGKTAIRFYCSDTCRNRVYDICGKGRAKKIKKYTPKSKP